MNTVSIFARAALHSTVLDNSSQPLGPQIPGTRQQSGQTILVTTTDCMNPETLIARQSRVYFSPRGICQYQHVDPLLSVSRTLVSCVGRSRLAANTRPSFAATMDPFGARRRKYQVRSRTRAVARRTLALTILCRDSFITSIPRSRSPAAFH